jgi:hypothetical protein
MESQWLFLFLDIQSSVWCGEIFLTEIELITEQEYLRTLYIRPNMNLE